MSNVLKFKALFIISSPPPLFTVQFSLPRMIRGNESFANIDVFEGFEGCIEVF